MPEYPSQAVRMEARSEVSLRTKQRLAPAAIQGLEVLSLPITRLDAYVRDLVERNPLLDFDYDHASLSFEEIPEEDDDRASGSADEDAESAYARPASIAWDAHGFDLARLRDECSETETLQSHLRMQLTGACASERDRLVLDALIENIDDDGYFSGSMPAVCAEAGCSTDDGQRLLALVQTLTPRGVGARDLAECLMLQLDDDVPYAPVIRAMLQNSLEDLAENRTTKLTRAYHVSVDDLSATATARIIGSGPMAMTASYFTPDLIFSSSAVVPNPLWPLLPSSVMMISSVQAFFISSSRMIRSLLRKPTIRSTSAPCSCRALACGYAMAVPSPDLLFSADCRVFPDR